MDRKRLSAGKRFVNAFGFLFPSAFILMHNVEGLYYYQTEESSLCEKDGQNWRDIKTEDGRDLYPVLLFPLVFRFEHVSTNLSATCSKSERSFKK